jgi:hypothetical protein
MFSLANTAASGQLSRAYASAGAPPVVRANVRDICYTGDAMEARARKRVGAALGVVGVAFLAAVACSSTTLQGTIAIVTGPDNGFLVSPQPNLLAVYFVGSNAQRTLAAQTRLPSDGGLTLPTQPGANVDIIQVAAFVDSGLSAVVSGSTIPVGLDQLNGITLNVFAQRTGQFSRLPSAEGGSAATVTLPSTTPLLATLYGRYLLMADGTGKSLQTQLYDNLTWSTEPQPPCLSIPSLSLAYVNAFTGTDAALDSSTGVSALLQIGKGGAVGWLDITDSTGCDAAITYDAATLPNGGQWSAVAGGQTIVTPATGSGNTYVVGATRLVDGGATTGVLRISPSGVLSWTTLQVPRVGAAAAYVSAGKDGPGLYVFGGTAPANAGDAGADGSVPAETGVEFVADNGGVTVASWPMAGRLPADTTTGAGAFALNDGTIILAGGVTADGKPAPVRRYSYGGGDAAVSQGSGEGGAWPELPVTFVTAQVYALSDTTDATPPPRVDSVMVIGTRKSGLSSAYVLTPTSVTPIPFRVPGRTNVQSTILPNGSIAVVGGDDAGTMESFIR